MIEYKYDEKIISKKRKNMFNKFIKKSENIKSGDIQQISPKDIKLLFELYDEIFLNNFFKNEFQGNIKFSLSKRMVKSAGITLCPKNIGQLDPRVLVIEIRIGVDFFFQYELSGRDKSVCGIETNNSLEALQLVLEHEICHVLEFINYHESNCKGDRFKAIANNLFGHTSSYHRLPTNMELAKEKLDLSIGDEISFHFKEDKLNGIIYNINKRATVMVKDIEGNYIDKNGNRYTKYYVPLDKIMND